MKIKTFAKLNLSLDICGKREDGYHLLDSVMLSVDPADILTIEKNDIISVECSNPGLSGEDNIAFKAAKAFFEAVGIKTGASIHIEKHIPEAAGLGGGSADAAAVIRGLDKLFETNLSTEQLQKIGLKVGADVPFCIDGGCARVGGIGEIVSPLEKVENIYFVIAKNGKKGSTGAMYGMLDGSDEDKCNDTPELIEALKTKNINQIAAHIGNAFTLVAGLYNMDDNFASTKPLKVSLSGSGPSVFAVYADADSAHAAQRFISDMGIECYYAEPKEKGIIFE